MSKELSGERAAFERELVSRIPNAQLQLRDADDEVRPGEYEHATHEFAWQMWQAQAAISHKSEGAVSAELDFKSLVDRFLMWPIPSGVTSDRCVTESNYQYPRSGTNLLGALEADAMLRHVLAGLPVDASQPRRPTDDALWDQTLRERDEAEEIGTQLALAVGEFFGIDVGEHSSANDPRVAALKAFEEVADIPLASKLIDAWTAQTGRQIPWDKAVRITAIATNQPDAERDALLSMADDVAPAPHSGEAATGAADAEIRALIVRLSDTARHSSTQGDRDAAKEAVRMLAQLGDAIVAQAAQGTEIRHVGGSRFESWYSDYNVHGAIPKQIARDAYAAGMGDQTVATIGEAGGVVATVHVPLVKGGLEVGEPVIEFARDFESKMDATPGKRFSLFSAQPQAAPSELSDAAAFFPYSVVENNDDTQSE